MFLYDSNEQSEKEIKITIRLIMAWKRIKYLGMNITKKVKDLYTLTIKHWQKLKKTWINGRTAHVNGLEDLDCWDRNIAQSYLKI